MTADAKLVAGPSEISRSNGRSNNFRLSRLPLTQHIMLQNSVRIIYLVVGYLCTTLGVIGAFLPVLPTTPFLLVALWAFSKSSPRLKNWLYHHPRYGRTLQQWFEYGAISVRVKVIACTAMLCSVPVVYFISGSMIAVSVHGTIIFLTAIFILSRPSTLTEGNSGDSIPIPGSKSAINK